MSFAITNTVLSSNLPAGLQHTLAVFATFADAGGLCWPSNETVALKSNKDERTVRRHVEELEEIGVIKRTYRKGKSAITRIILSALQGYPTPDILPTPPRTSCPPESAIESVNEITAQPPAPELAESPAIAAIVVSESADTEARPAVDLVEDDPLAEVPAALLADFGIVRKAKKKAATVTKTEAVVFAAEAKKAGLTVAQAITTCVLRGWSRFEAAWLPQQAPAIAPGRVYVPEVAPPASPDVIAAHRATLAALREKISRQGKASTTWATAALAKAAKGEHVAPAAMAAARAALRL